VFAGCEDCRHWGGSKLQQAEFADLNSTLKEFRRFYLTLFGEAR